MKTALITGGSRGIGAAIVRALTAQGWRVAFCYKSSQEAAEQLSRETGDEEEKPSKGIKVDYAQEVSNQLSAILGRKVKLIEGRKTGRIEIEFYGSDDREALIDTLRNIK